MLHSLPIYLILFLLESSLYIRGVHSSNVFSRAIQRTHRIATRHTKGIARDLRLAFGAVLVSEPAQHTLTNERTVYCSASGSGLGSSSSSGTSNSSSGGSAGTGTSTTAVAAASPTASAVSTPWKLVEAHNGSDFFQGWTFWNAADPTDGTVDYLDESDATAANLAYVNSAGNAIMAVDTTNNITGNRKSVRITTNSQYSQALWILTAKHIPTGCGTWPAFWTNGPNWPAGGEIDIVEGVNAYTTDQSSIHTEPGCNMPSDNSTILGITGTVIGGTNCAEAETEDQGCGVLASASNVSFGAPFNSNGGGIYASKLDDTGVSVHFWPMDQAPSDILAGTPLPSSWGQPLAAWAATDCNPSTFFSDHSAIFDTTLCGVWAGEVWNDSDPAAGQDQSCAQMTGYPTCAEYVMAEGSAFSEAYWEVQSVKIYQT